MIVHKTTLNFAKKSILAITFAGAVSTAVQANFIDDSTLDVQLRNEFRDAERPSASGAYGPQINAWVQGFLFDFSSGKINDIISIDAALYNVQKISADDDKSSRFYLDGHESYTIGGASINLDLAKWAQFKVGRFGTDYLYGSLDHFVPLIDNSSNRTEPTMAEGVLWRGDFANDIYLYGMYSTKEAGRYKKQWTDTGLLFTDEEKPVYNLAALWQTETSNVKIGWQGMDEHADQLQVEAGHTWKMPDDSTVRLESRFYYAKTKGLTKAHSLDKTGEDDTYVASAMGYWMKDDWTFSAAMGKAGNKLDGSVDIDTDVGYVFDLSIDRNGQDMFSWQVGAMYALTPSLKIGAAVTLTDGYESHTKTVEQEGLGGTIMMFHNVKEGRLKGLSTSIVYSVAKEDRVGSSKGDELDYNDLMVKIHYPVNIF